MQKRKEERKKKPTMSTFNIYEPTNWDLTYLSLYRNKSAKYFMCISTKLVHQISGYLNYSETTIKGVRWIKILQGAFTLCLQDVHSICGIIWDSERLTY